MHEKQPRLGQGFFQYAACGAVVGFLITLLITIPLSYLLDPLVSEIVNAVISISVILSALWYALHRWSQREAVLLRQLLTENRPTRFEWGRRGSDD